MTSKQKSRKKIIAQYLNDSKKLHKNDERLVLFRVLIDESRKYNLDDLVLLFEGYEYIEKKKYEVAIEKFRQALALNNDFALPWNGLGIVYRNQNSFEKAIEAYTKAIELDEKFAFPWSGLGNVYSDQKNFGKAAEAYLKAIELDEKYASPWNGLGNVYSDQKNFEKATEAYLKAIELDEKYATPWNGLGIMYSDQKNFEKAAEAYLKAIELDEKFTHSYRNYALTLQENGNLKEAKPYFEKALECFKAESDQYWISITENNLKELNEKIKAQQAIRTYKDTAYTDDPLARVLSETEAFEKEIFENQKEFQEFVKDYVWHEEELFYIKVLRRWNSYTPIVADNYHVSKGGGYFLKIKGKGIVIDPGFNFIDNFKGAGHCFDEIDIVMITHAHNDHTSDIESIITLLNNCNKRRKGLDDYTSDDTIRSDIAKKEGVDIQTISNDVIEKEFLQSPRRKNIDLYFTKSVDKKYGGMLNLYSKDDYSYHIIEKGDEKALLDGMLKVKVISAKHDDIISDRDSVGFLFDFDDTILIYTGDTGWNNEIEKQYQNIRKEFDGKHMVLLAHLGGFKEYENKYLIPDERSKSFYKDHLGRLGLARLVSVIKPDICFISEFGEELKKHREEITDIYNQIFDSTTFFLSADIGLEYHIHDKKIRAITEINSDKSECRRDFIEPRDVKTCLLRKDYSLHYFNSKARFKEGDLIQVLIEQFERSLK